MLQVNLRPEVGKIIVLKLVSGEEIVAKLMEDNRMVIFIQSPVSVGLDQTGRVAMMPFMVSLKDKAKLPITMANVIIYAEAREEMANAYIKHTTNIMPASTTDLAGIKPNDKGAVAGGGASGGFKPNT